MPFTDKERRAWHKARRHRNGDAQPHGSATCLHCKNPFAPGNGVVTGEAAFCDICLG